jgi:hypothetical protein
MKIQYILRILLTIVLTTAALGRIVYPEISEKEKNDIPFMNETGEKILITYELLSVYFLLLAPIYLRNMYLWGYIIPVLLLSLYYIIKGNLIKDIKEVCIYPNDIKSVLIHLLYIGIMCYMVYTK